MLTKDDLMKLSKERLCELLLEEWNKDTSASKEILVPCNHPIPKQTLDCKNGGQCTNPYHDCIDCPRIFTGGTSECGIGLTTQASKWITTHDGTVMTQDELILTSKEKQQ